MGLQDSKSARDGKTAATAARREAVEAPPKTDRRDDRGRFAQGNAGGPGRPQVSISAAIKRISDPHAIAELLWRVAMDEKADMKDRKWAITFIADRTEGLPVQQHLLAAQINHSNVAFPVGWQQMNPLARSQWVDSLLSGQRLLSAGAVAGVFDATSTESDG